MKYMATLRVAKNVDGCKQELDSLDMMKSVGLEWKKTYEKKNIPGSKEPKMQEARERIHQQMSTNR